jgi:hypothetical protein
MSDSGASADDSQLRLYFQLLRPEVGNCAIPSRLHDELLVIAKTALRSPDPPAFLQSFGLLFFEECCAVNVAALAASLSSGRSRISAAFGRERFAQCQSVPALRPRLTEL